MKGWLLVAVTFISPGLAPAQYGPPARDLRDAARMLQDVQRLIEPAIAAVRDDTAVLNALSKAEKQLKDPQPMSSFDDATKVIDDFARRRAGIDSPLSRDLQITVDAARRILIETRPAMNPAAARERMHHQVVHPLQRQVIRNIEQLQQLTQQLQFMSQRATMPALPEALNAAGYASTDIP